MVISHSIFIVTGNCDVTLSATPEGETLASGTLLSYCETYGNIGKLGLWKRIKLGTKMFLFVMEGGRHNRLWSL